MFGLVFVADFPNQWPSFFDDLLQSLHMGEKTVDMYLRVLMAIDTEVIDTDITHSQTVSYWIYFLFIVDIYLNNLVCL